MLRATERQEYEHTKLLEYIEAFVKEIPKLDGLKDVQHSLNILKSHRDRIKDRRYDEGIKQVENIREKPNYGFFNDILEDRTLASVAKKALAIVEVAEKLWWQSRRVLSEDMVQLTYKRFGIDGSLNFLTGNNENRGLLFQNIDGAPHRPSGEEMLAVRAVYFDGIDQNGFKKTFRPQTELIKQISGHDAAFYHYDSKPAELGDAFAAVLRKRSGVHDAHRRAAQEIIDARTESVAMLNLDWLSVRYSNGVMFGLGVDNAIEEILRDPQGSHRLSDAAIKDVFSQQRVFSIGMQPVWGTSKYSESFTQSPDLSIVAADDMLFPTSIYFRGIVRDMMANPAGPAVRALSDGGNKVSLVVAPGLVYNHIDGPNGKKLPNFGKHSSLHYMASLGLCDGIEASCLEMRKMGEVVREYLENGVTKETSLSAMFHDHGVGVEILDKSDYRGRFGDQEKEGLDLGIIKSYATALAEEQRYMQKPHILLNGNGAERSMSR